mgnify:CR=1 FL=1
MRSIVTFSLPPTLTKQMNQLAVRYKTNRSQIIQQAINDFLTRHEFNQLRQRLMKKAKGKSIFTDEDVFQRVS